MATATELTKAFLQTPAMIEHAEVIGAVNNELNTDDTVTAELQIPRQFLKMLEFVERTEAEDGGRQPEEVGEVLNLMLVNQLQEMLHWLVVAPARFPRYQKLWNRFCDEQGAPEHKIVDADEEAAPTGPF